MNIVNTITGFNVNSGPVVSKLPVWARLAQLFVVIEASATVGDRFVELLLKRNGVTVGSVIANVPIVANEAGYLSVMGKNVVDFTITDTVTEHFVCYGASPVLLPPETEVYATLRGNAPSDVVGPVTVLLELLG